MCIYMAYVVCVSHCLLLALHCIALPLIAHLPLFLEQEHMEHIVNSLFEISLETVTEQENSSKSESGIDCRETQNANTTLSVEDLKTYLKCVSHQYEIFPELKFFAVDAHRVRQLIFQLCQNRQFPSVRRLVILFHEVLEVDFLKLLVSFVVVSNHNARRCV